MKPLLLSLATFTVCASCAHAATYIEPNLNGKVLVRVDQIPLDTNTMRWMASCLTELAEQQAGSNDAKKLQASAKLLALAKQLDKSLPQINVANLKLKQRTPSKPNPKHADHQRKRMRSILEYLETDESNPEGKLLSKLTKDALAPIAPQKSLLAKFSAPNEIWQNSIAGYDKFTHTETPKLVNNERVKHSEVKPTPKPIIEPQKPKAKVTEPISSAEWKVKALSIVLPFTSYEIVGEYDKSVYSTGLKKMAIKISSLPDDGDGSSTFHSTPHHESDHLQDFTWSVFEPLQSHWKNIPPAKFSFKLSNAYSYHSDKQLTSSALIVAFDSALLGKPLKSNLLIISSINKKAEFRRSNKFWQTLKTLTEEARDSRILVAPGSEEYLLQLLALGHPEFFIQNEVIEIENLKQARKLTSTNDHDDYAEATTLFAEVKSAIERKSLRSMTENKYVREKLEKVLDSMPNHLSAKILLEYGARKKPSILESKFFAIEMKSLLHSIDKTLTTNASSLTDKSAADQSDKIAQALEKIRDFISSEDQEVYDKVDKMCGELRAFSKAKKSANEKDTSYYINAAKRSLRELKDLNNQLQIDIARLSGIPLKEE